MEIQEPQTAALLNGPDKEAAVTVRAPARHDTPFCLFYARPLNPIVCQSRGEVEKALRNLIDAIPEYPVLVLSELGDNLARLYHTNLQLCLNLQERLDLFKCVACEAMLTLGDLLLPNHPQLGENLQELRLNVDALAQLDITGLGLPSSCLEAARSYLATFAAGNSTRDVTAALFAGLPESRLRTTLGQLRGQVLSNPGVGLVDGHLKCCSSVEALSGPAAARSAGYSMLINAALLSPAEQTNTPDLLRVVLQRLAKFELGILLQLAVNCDLRYLGFLLFYAASEATDPQPLMMMPSGFKRLMLNLCPARWHGRVNSDWELALMVLRAAGLVVDSMPGLAPTRRCDRFFSFAEVPSYHCLPSRNIYPAAFSSDAKARERIGTDESVLRVFRKQLNAQSLGAIIIFVDSQMLGCLGRGEQFIVSALRDIATRQAENPELRVAWCLEQNPRPLMEAFPTIPRDSLFEFGGLRQTWKVWRDILRLLDCISYKSTAATADS